MTDAANTTKYIATSECGALSFFFEAPRGAGRAVVIAAMEAAVPVEETVEWEVYERAPSDDTYSIWAR